MNLHKHKYIYVYIFINWLWQKAHYNVLFSRIYALGELCREGTSNFETEIVNSIFDVLLRYFLGFSCTYMHMWYYFTRISEMRRYIIRSPKGSRLLNKKIFSVKLKRDYWYFCYLKLIFISSYNRLWYMLINSRKTR